MKDNQDHLTFLIGDIPEEQFLTEYWRARFLFLSGAGSDLIESMPSLDEVEEILGREGVEEEHAVRFVSFPLDAKPVYRVWLVGGDGAPSRDPGEPVNLLQADRFFSRLKPLAERLAGVFGVPANLQLFYGHEGQGLSPHTDIHDSFVVQIHGCKRWYVSDLPCKGVLKTGNEGAVLPPDAVTYDLAPGDVLYKPSNAAHATETIRGPSLSLTASIVTRTAGDVFIDYLRGLMTSDPAWLERFPLDPHDQETRRRLEAACRKLAGRLPPVQGVETWCRS